MTYSKQTIAAGVAVATVLLALYTQGFGVPKLEDTQPTPTKGSAVPIENTTNTENWQSYSNPALGISFKYPQGLFVVERDLSTGNRSRYHIALFYDTPFNRDLVAGKVQGTDGPQSISIELFQNDLDRLSAERWVNDSADSNYKLAVAPYELFDFAGMPAVAYEHDGLYRTRAIVTADERFIYSFTVGMISNPDPLLSVFEQILPTIEIL